MVTNSYFSLLLFFFLTPFFFFLSVWNTIRDGASALQSRVSWGLWNTLVKWWLLISVVALFGWYVHQVSVVWADCWLCCIGTMRTVLVHAHTYTLVHTKRLHRGMCYEAIALIVPRTLVATVNAEKHGVHAQIQISFFFLSDHLVSYSTFRNALISSRVLPVFFP